MLKMLVVLAFGDGRPEGKKERRDHFGSRKAGRNKRLNDSTQ
jgi:hypothetical protein